jgi:hypothetical protein
MKAIAACSILKIMLTFWISLLFGKTCISQVMNWNNNQSENTDSYLGGNAIAEICRCPITSCSYVFFTICFHYLVYTTIILLCLIDLTLLYQLQEFGNCIELWEHVARMHKISYTCKVRLGSLRSTMFPIS